MSKKLSALITGISMGIGTIAIALVTYFSPENMVAIVASIGIAETAISEICVLFEKEK